MHHFDQNKLTIPINQPTCFIFVATQPKTGYVPYLQLSMRQLSKVREQVES